MEEIFNPELERKIAKQAVKQLRDELMKYYPQFRDRKSVVKGFRSREAFFKRVGYRFEDGRLSRLIVYATKYSFQMHYGYDLIPKSEWQKRRRSRKFNSKPPAQRDVPGTEHFSKALNSGVLENLAEQLSQLRFIQIGNMFKEVTK